MTVGLTEGPCVLHALQVARDTAQASDLRM